MTDALPSAESTVEWHRLDVADLAVGHVKTVIVAGRALTSRRSGFLAVHI